MSRLERSLIKIEGLLTVPSLYISNAKLSNKLQKDSKKPLFITKGMLEYTYKDGITMGVVRMMSVISVTPDQLREQSRVYIQARDEVQAAKERVDAMNNQIAEQWKGQAFQAYLQQFEQLAGHVKQFNELLVSINEQLNKYATTIEERDRQDAGAFGLN